MEGNADFSGYATKANLKCSDGRTIMPEAFQHMDGKQVPLVWQHRHDDVGNVLGHAILEARPDGVYAYGFFNESEAGQKAKALVQHKDVNALSIYANSLVEKSKQVFHGVIRELSLVLAGANPGAFIDNIAIQHSDGDIETLDDKAIIYSGLELSHTSAEDAPEGVEVADEAEEPEEPEEVDEETEEEDEELAHAAGNMTLQEVYDSLTSDQKNLVNYMVGVAVEAATEGAVAQHSNESEDDLSGDANNADKEEGTTDMTHNLFDQNGDKGAPKQTLSHDALETIVSTAKKNGSLKEAFLEHADAYGITDIDLLFPDAQSVTSQPDLIARRTAWVAGVLDGAKHSPFARIKSLAADLTADEARAKGYVKGNLKKDEVIKLLKRVTIPTTIYKKQKLDRDDIVDITGLDVVAWLKWEMRFMLEEEIARAILIGDGREPDDEDKIDEEKLRPIAWDDDMYAHKITVPSNTSPDSLVESILRARKFYKGTGTPAFYTTDDILTDMLLIKDKMGRRVYATEAELAAALRVSSIIVVEVMENESDLLGIMVNIADYTIGADRGGQLSMFDDFDIDYNQQKYLMETRISGALTKPKSAVVVQRVSGTTVSPSVPSFDSATKTLTVPNVTGVEYYDVTDALGETKLSAGDVVLTRTTDVEARPVAGYNFPHNTDADWTFAVVA